MKKLLLAIIILLGLLLLSAYIFFPKEVKGSNAETVDCSINSISRFVMMDSKWWKWWPGKIKRDSLSGSGIPEYNGFRYVITKREYNALFIQMQKPDLNIEGAIFFLPLDKNMVQVEWKYSLETNSNPINRIHLYLETKKINKSIVAVMNSMKIFLENKENVYGMRIDQVLVKDTILVTTNFSSTQYPNTEKIYEAVAGIKNYIASNNSKETNFPMLHVWQDSGLYKTQVAIPVSVTIPQTNKYLIKRMVAGKILVGQVTGGTYATSEAMKQMKIFLTDNHLSSPAIPFESLVTNRMQEPDTTKWITKIYYPIF